MRMPSKINILKHPHESAKSGSSRSWSGGAHQRRDHEIPRSRNHEIQEMMIPHNATRQRIVIFFPPCLFGESEVDHLFDKVHLAEDLERGGDQVALSLSWKRVVGGGGGTYCAGRIERERTRLTICRENNVQPLG